MSIPLTTSEQRSVARRASVGSFVGAVVDWYDFYIYGILAALVFNELFFTDASPAVGTLAAFATFGVGFLFRPLGGVFFGHFGDRIGRKNMLVVTILTMGTATVLIGLLPTYTQIGVTAPLLLTVLRAVQGFAVGGEWGGATLMAVENAPAKAKAFYSSGVQVGASVGLLIATAAIQGVSALTTDEQFAAWGWRIPFLASAAVVGIGLLVRLKAEESQVFLAEVAARPQDHLPSFPLLKAIRANPRAFGTIVGLRFVELFTFFLVTTFAVSYGSEHFGLDRDELLTVNLVVGALAIVTIPVFAHLSDRVGRRRVYVAAGVIGAAGAVPYFMALESGRMLLIVPAAVVLVNLAHDLAVSVQQPLFTEMFGAAYRYSGAGVGYQLASAIGGGFTPLIAGSLVMLAGGGWRYVALYLLAGCLVSLALALRIKASDSQNAAVSALDATPT
ncbi:shikimate transporter [Mycolicibacterium stellerae]|uniref:shikimate transporter n=1 Tax=Mycolicibacterium stellerae TaxID=2358193 RepID=UPI000F0B3A06|nr:shikimate transporter [Mycolicibacterium stellerae]